MRWSGRQFRSFIAIWKWWRDRFSPGGKLLTLILLISLPVLSDINSPLFLYSLALLCILTVSATIGYRFRPVIDCRLLAVETASVGEVIQIPIQITNVGKRAAFDLTCSIETTNSAFRVIDDRAQIAALAPRQSATVNFTLSACRRGVFPSPIVRTASGFPLELVRFSCTHQLSGNLTVMPYYEPLDDDFMLMQAGSMQGVWVSKPMGAGSGWDYCGNREYVPGVPVKRWDYGSWARLGYPVVREYSDPENLQAIVFLNTRAQATSSADIPGDGDITYPYLERSIPMPGPWHGSINGLIQLATVIAGSRRLEVPKGVQSRSHFETLLFLASLQPEFGARLWNPQDLSNLDTGDAGIALLVTDRADQDRNLLTEALDRKGIAWHWVSPNVSFVPETERHFAEAVS